MTGNNDSNSEVVNCCYCGMKGKKSEMHLLFGEYSHPGCDSSLLEKQDKKVKYLDKLRSEQYF